MNKTTIFIGALGAVLALAAMPAGADYIETSYVGTFDEDDGVRTWSHSDESRVTGDALNSSVAFSMNDQELQVVLSNNSPQPTDDLADVLQGVFFTVDNGLGLTGDSVDFGESSLLVPKDYEGDIEEQNWAYRDELDSDDNPFNAVYGVTHGIANPGLDTFSSDDTFPEGSGTGKQPPYGIVSPDEDDDPYDPWPFADPQQPMVMNSLQFTFDKPDNFDLADIDNVVFHYGTTASVVPEPATMTLLGLGLAGLGARRYVKIRNKT